MNVPSAPGVPSLDQDVAPGPLRHLLGVLSRCLSQSSQAHSKFQTKTSETIASPLQMKASPQCLPQEEEGMQFLSEEVT